MPSNPKKIIKKEDRPRGRFLKIICDLHFEGDGTPIYAQRLIDDRPVSFISNVESNRPIRGVLSGYGRSEEVILYPGEIHYFSAADDSFSELPRQGRIIAKLSVKTEVTFAADNLLPPEGFSYEGNTLTKTDKSHWPESGFTVSDPLKGPRLYAPASCVNAESAVFPDGQILRAEETAIYDDAYFMYALPELAIGAHLPRFVALGTVAQSDRLFVRGDFDADVQTSGYPYARIHEVYNLTVFIPCTARITLSSRRKELFTDDSRAMQGQPLYFGIVEYRTTLYLPENGSYRLTLPRVRDAVWCRVDDSIESKRIAPPYVFGFDAEKGVHRLTLRVANSFANAMKCCLKRSGILAGGKIEPL